MPLHSETKPAAKSRLKRLFEKQFPKLAGNTAGGVAGDAEVEPSSVCLDRMVVNFIEDNNEKQSAKCGRRRCNCFNGEESSDDDFFDDPVPKPIPADAAEIIKGLIQCESATERDLLADATKTVESAAKSKIGKKKDDLIKFVAENLRNIGRDASVCKSHWDKTPSIPAGEYSYIDVIIGEDRYILEIDLKSEFEIARSTKHYRSVLQHLPSIFIGKPERLQKIVAVVSDAARASLKKKGLHVPPWRKPEYAKAKWLSPYDRRSDGGEISAVGFSGEFEMRKQMEKITVVVSPWQPPPVKPKPVAKIVTGLSDVLTEKPTVISE